MSSRVLVCGGRIFGDHRRDALAFGYHMTRLNHELGPFDVIIHGGATGADQMAGVWAAMAGLDVLCWTVEGRSASPVSNQRMIDEGKPDLVIAFPGGRGTADTVRRARQAGIQVIEVET